MIISSAPIPPKFLVAMQAFHLLGGLLTFALLAWTAWNATDVPIRVPDVRHARRLLVVAIALLAVQIALGGWTSSNYAALACGTDFPTCVGKWWPPHDFGQGFVLWRGVGVEWLITDHDRDDHRQPRVPERVIYRCIRTISGTFRFGSRDGC